MEPRDGPLIKAMSGLADLYPRHGYRRIQVLMERLGHFMGLTEHFGFGAKQGCKRPKSAFLDFYRAPPHKLMGLKEHFELHFKECEWRCNKPSYQLIAKLKRQASKPKIWSSSILGRTPRQREKVGPVLCPDLVLPCELQ